MIFKTATNGTHVPQQRRSAATLNRIITATGRLLEQSSFDELSVGAIAKAARAPVGSFYARFESKEALLPALYEHYRASLEQGDAILRQRPAITLKQQVSTLIATQIKRFRAHRGFLRAIAQRERHQQTTMHSELERWGVAATNRRIAALQPFAAEINHPEPRKAIKHGLYFVMAIIREKILFGDSPHASITPMSDRVLQRELTTLLINYLRGPSWSVRATGSKSGSQSRRSTQERKVRSRLKM